MVITATALVCSLPGTTLAQDDESQMLRANGASSNSDVNVALDGINRVLEKEMDVLEKEEEDGIGMRFKSIDELGCQELKEAIAGILGAAVDFEQQRIAYEGGKFVAKEMLVFGSMKAGAAAGAAVGAVSGGFFAGVGAGPGALIGAIAGAFAGQHACAYVKMDAPEFFKEYKEYCTKRKDLGDSFAVAQKAYGKKKEGDCPGDGKPFMGCVPIKGGDPQCVHKLMGEVALLVASGSKAADVAGCVADPSACAAAKIEEELVSFVSGGGDKGNDCGGFKENLANK